MYLSVSFEFIKVFNIYNFISFIWKSVSFEFVRKLIYKNCLFFEISKKNIYWLKCCLINWVVDKYLKRLYYEGFSEKYSYNLRRYNMFLKFLIFDYYVRINVLKRICGCECGVCLCLRKWENWDRIFFVEGYKCVKSNIKEKSKSKELYYG